MISDPTCLLLGFIHKSILGEEAKDGASKIKTSQSGNEIVKICCIPNEKSKEQGRVKPGRIHGKHLGRMELT